MVVRLSWHANGYFGFKPSQRQRGNLIIPLKKGHMSSLLRGKVKKKLEYPKKRPPYYCNL
jgi:hypothetical protein